MLSRTHSVRMLLCRLCSFQQYKLYIIFHGFDYHLELFGQASVWMLCFVVFNIGTVPLLLCVVFTFILEAMYLMIRKLVKLGYRFEILTLWLKQWCLHNIKWRTKRWHKKSTYKEKKKDYMSTILRLKIKEKRWHRKMSKKHKWLNSSKKLC